MKEGNDNEENDVDHDDEDDIREPVFFWFCQEEQ